MVRPSPITNAAERRRVKGTATISAGVGALSSSNSAAIVSSIWALKSAASSRAIENSQAYGVAVPLIGALVPEKQGERLRPEGFIILRLRKLRSERPNVLDQENLRGGPEIAADLQDFGKRSEIREAEGLLYFFLGDIDAIEVGAFRLDGVEKRPDIVLHPLPGIVRRPAVRS